MYADSVTRSMEAAISETERRREIQKAYNEKNGIVPQTIIKDVREILEISGKSVGDIRKRKLSKAEKEKEIEILTKQMKEAAKLLEFEHAAMLRDKIKKLKEE
jgi:excinuclease ABC subunit B